ncbi:hypothetical protein JWG45_12705 [Leptospira sp. 201903070]|uniref:Uncharacterized protein n=1 Tax=Leptospira ainlahdjerensis TaxID=2810033 RepID=A0ABS2UCA0_9LEPT|nr:hypothetical protein [Leptospira ainlahdjerensis]MBM9578009.1 hypothetical protein [Leptospira ainlahdjerensis]
MNTKSNGKTKAMKAGFLFYPRIFFDRDKIWTTIVKKTVIVFIYNQSLWNPG